MEIKALKCRKCRYEVLEGENLLKCPQQDDELCVSCFDVNCSMYFVDWDNVNIPNWLKSLLERSNFTKGKINCNHCGSRLGSFDFTNSSPCQCSEHQYPPVKFLKKQVDVQFFSPNIPDVSFPSPTSSPIREPISSVDISLCDCDFEDEHLDLTKDIPNEIPNETPSKKLPIQETSSNVHTFNFEYDNVSLQNRFDSLEVEDISQDCSEVTPDDHSYQDQCQEEKIDDEVTCPICLEVFYLPHICQPCLHNFCSPCLRRLHGIEPVHTKCPLCREVIHKCVPNKELDVTVQLKYNEAYHARRKIEKPKQKKLPSLPSYYRSPPRLRGRNTAPRIMLTNWAGVCFVVILIMLAVSIFITTVTVTAWYIWEFVMDNVLLVIVYGNQLYDNAWNTLWQYILNKSIPPQQIKILMGSFGQLLSTLSKLFNHTKQNELASKKTHSNDENNFIFSKIQADFTNYMIIMGFITYLIFQLARYVQQRHLLPAR